MRIHHKDEKNYRTLKIFITVLLAIMLILTVVLLILE